MNKTVKTPLILMISILVGGNIVAITASSAVDYIVVVEIDTVEIVEDRDIGTAEIYLKVTVDSGTPLYTGITTGVTDGDFLWYNWELIDEQRSRYELRIEVWESDDGYDEGANDFLGYLYLDRNVPINNDQWHDTTGRVGGNLDIQARIFLEESATEVVSEFPSVFPLFLVTVLITPLIYLKKRK